MRACNHPSASPVCLTRLPRPSASPVCLVRLPSVCLTRLPHPSVSPVCLARLPVERGRKTKEKACELLFISIFRTLKNSKRRKIIFISSFRTLKNSKRRNISDEGEKRKRGQLKKMNKQTKTKKPHIFPIFYEFLTLKIFLISR